MKLPRIKPLLAVGMLLFCIAGYAQNHISQNDSTVNAIKIKNLKNRKAVLQRSIEAEDKKRNAVIDGVLPETLEKRNAKQDSICLELRSELTSVGLELKELGADNTTTKIAQQYNNLIRHNQPDSVRATVPNKPTAPAKLTKSSNPSKSVKPSKKE